MIAVLDYGIGNLRSAQKALERVGADAVLTDDVAVVRAAEAVVLPGVGAFGRCMEALREAGLDDVARGGDRGRARRSSGSASACRCSTRASEEDPDVPGLGVLAGTVAPPARRREAPADAVERARPGRRRCRPCSPASTTRPVGLLRPLLRAGDDRRRGGHLRLRRAGGGRRPAGPAVGHPVPPREVGRGRAAAFAGQLRWTCTPRSTCGAADASASTRATSPGRRSTAPTRSPWPRGSRPPAPGGSTSSTSTPPAPARPRTGP